MDQNKCKYCGNVTKEPVLVCPNCGHTDWIGIIPGGIIALFFLFSAFKWISKWETFRCLQWPVVVLSVIFLVVVVSESVKGIKAMNKYKLFKAQHSQEMSGTTSNSPVTSTGRIGLSSQNTNLNSYSEKPSPVALPLNANKASQSTQKMVKCPSCANEFILPRVVIVPQHIIDVYGNNVIQCPRCQHVFQREEASLRPGFSGAQVSDIPVEEHESKFDFSHGVINSYSGNATALVIPAKIGGEVVTGIGISAFRDKKLTSVTLPDTLEVIYDDAFSMNQLTNVVIPNSVNRIFDHAFEENNLNHVTLSDNLAKLGAGVFVKNRLTKVVFPMKIIQENPQMQYQLMQAFDAGVKLEGI